MVGFRARPSRADALGYDNAMLEIETQLDISSWYMCGQNALEREVICDRCGPEERRAWPLSGTSSTSSYATMFGVDVPCIDVMLLVLVENTVSTDRQRHRLFNVGLSRYHGRARRLRRSMSSPVDVLYPRDLRSGTTPLKATDLV